MMRELQSLPATERSYSVPVGYPGAPITAEWRWPDKQNAIWVMAEREGVSWTKSGPLTEEGRQALLEHFDLEDCADELPLERIQKMSPHVLDKKSQKSRSGKSRNWVHQSDRIGDHVAAAYVI